MEANVPTQSPRPAVILVDGASARLDEALVRLSVHDDLDGRSTCELEFADVGPREDGSPSFLVFDPGVLELGSPITVVVDADALFRGTITAIEGRLPTETAPTVAVSARSQVDAQPSTADPLTLMYGQDLTELRIARQVASTIESPQPGVLVQGDGTTRRLPVLRAGATVRLMGIGPRFEGEYCVRTVTHLFDLLAGFRTNFTVRQGADG